MEIPIDNTTVKWLVEQLVELKCAANEQSWRTQLRAARREWTTAYDEARKHADKRVYQRLLVAARKAAKDGNSTLEKELREVAKWVVKDDQE